MDSDEEKRERLKEEEDVLETESKEEVFIEEREVRMEKNKKVEADFRAEIKQKTSLVESSITKLVDMVFGLVVEKEELVDKREETIFQYKNLVENLKKLPSDSNNEDANLQKPSTSQKSTTTEEDFEAGGKITEMVSFLQENGIASVEELQNQLTELSKLKRERKLNENLQAKLARASSTREADATIEANLKQQIGLLEEKKKSLEEKMRQMEADFSKTEKKVVDGKPNVPCEFSFEKEIARETKFDDTLNEFSPTGSGDNEEKFVRKPHYHTHWDMGMTSEMKMFAMMQQMQTENRLPDPPKYSAEANSTSMDAFTRTFKMKYGRLSDEQQVVLLEANFLSGKALKVFKSIAEYEKVSFESVMAAMADRLRVSEVDESHRAKNRWEQLQRKDNQSIEDYCLAIDELAKRAFVGMSQRQLSSMKIAKLLNAIAIHENMASAIEDKIEDIPVAEQYEAARKKAIRMERGIQERKKVRQSGGEKKESSESKDSNEVEEKSQQKAQTPKISGPPKNNKQHGFNLPSNNYQANQSNKNHQFSSSTPLPQQSLPSQLNQNQTASMNSNGSAVNDSVPGFQGCGECKQLGFHDPNCSKAPRMSRKPIYCYFCLQDGHLLKHCPLLPKNKKEAQTNGVPAQPVASLNEGVSTLENKTVLYEVSTSESVDIPRLKYEKGVIAGVNVELMIDSGACISLMSEKLWKKIVEKKGKQWEKSIRKEPPVLQTVVAADNQPINLLFQVTLETSMGSRTKKIPICVADVRRETVILGFNNFDALGVVMSIEEEPRTVWPTQNVEVVPGTHAIVEVQMEGYVKKNISCLIYPEISQIVPTVCQFGKNGRAYLTLSNFGKESVVLSKGQVIARGKLDDFAVKKEGLHGVLCLRHDADSLSKGSEGTMSDKKLDDYSSVTSVLDQGEAVIGLLEDRTANGSAIESVQFVEKDSAEGIAETIACCEYQESEGHQRCYTEDTDENFQDIGDICEKHTETENSFGLLCMEVETSEKSQIVCPMNAQVSVEQLGLCRKNVVNKVVEGFEVLNEVHEEHKKEICEKEKVSAQRTKSFWSYKSNDQKFSRCQDANFELEDVKQEKDPAYESQQGSPLRAEWKKEVRSDGREVPFGITVKEVSFPRKPGLQKQEDVAGRGVSLKKTERRAREETRPRKDPPRIYPVDMKEHDPVWLWTQQESSGVVVNCGSKSTESNLPTEPSESFNWDTANSKRVKEEHSPRKDPPSYDQWKLALEHHKVFMDMEVTKTTAISNRPSSIQVPLKDYIGPNIV